LSSIFLASPIQEKVKVFVSLFPGSHLWGHLLLKQQVAAFASSVFRVGYWPFRRSR
jgi:hypothetical protein